ncbi:MULTISPECIES: urease subunit gamma [unclassified Microbacterium]|uniref:urease subunit gamma n=1 Tax=unclassified Microbacterium TaxID=2609290 RepID=UPI00214BC16A|nr:MULTISPECIES: urease subunit gamma [unclassified Microbacterium]MCR2799906.1 urease subunit gamma [Microbacterium sp. zg.Y818]MCR2827754.1 urease subunit gamma [Microbacterium sp. zg.Y909]WIM21888.1 urease subunit gamma [Microbacterium sp. zg-Y818]
MDLTPREIDKLYVYQVAELARRRRDRGTKLNVSEAIALVTEGVLEAARDGKTVSDCMELGKKIVTVDQCMPGVRERVTLLQVEATFPDGTKLVSCHDPIGG